MTRPLIVALVAVLLACCPGEASAEIIVERSEKGAVVKIDGRLFTEYLTRESEHEADPLADYRADRQADDPRLPCAIAPAR